MDWLLNLDPGTYSSHIVIEKRVRVLYVEILRVIYGMLEAALLWYRKFRRDLEGIVLEFYP